MHVLMYFDHTGLRMLAMPPGSPTSITFESPTARLVILLFLSKCQLRTSRFPSDSTCHRLQRIRSRNLSSDKHLGGVSDAHFGCVCSSEHSRLQSQHHIQCLWPQLNMNLLFTTMPYHPTKISRTISACPPRLLQHLLLHSCLHLIQLL